MTTYRLTTNGMLHTYRANLQNSYNTLGMASAKVQTHRNFLSYAEDPSSATLAFKLRRQFWQTSSQIRNTQEVRSTFSQAYSTYDLVNNDVVEAVGKDNWLRALNEPDASGRRALGQSTLEHAESVVQSMNAKYAGRYIFAGADGLNAPFEIKECRVMQADGTVLKDDDGNEVMRQQLCYRGIPVDQPAKIVKMKDDGSGPELDPVTGEQVMVDNPEYLKLQEMLNETTYVDLGLGMQENPDGTPIKSTVYNSALSGLEFLDFGYDENGDPKNVVSLMLEGGNMLINCRDKDGDFEEGDPEYDRLFTLTQKVEAAIDKMHVEFTELTTKAGFLTKNETRLTTERDELEKRITDVEDIDPVAAITALSWAQYCYNAGLKIGNSILSQSLIDYMN